MAQRAWLTNQLKLSIVQNVHAASLKTTWLIAVPQMVYRVQKEDKVLQACEVTLVLTAIQATRVRLVLREKKERRVTKGLKDPRDQMDQKAPKAQRVSKELMALLDLKDHLVQRVKTGRRVHLVIKDLLVNLAPLVLLVSKVIKVQEAHLDKRVSQESLERRVL